jgi:predicted kinase
MRLLILIGLPGSGKSTLAARNQWPALSSDHVRLLLSGDETNQAIHQAVFASMRYLLRQRLRLGAPITVIDATNLRRTFRRPWIRIGQQFGCRVEAAWLDVPLEVCLERNASRPRAVPEEAIRRMAAQLQPPSMDEGFHEVYIYSSDNQKR